MEGHPEEECVVSIKKAVNNFGSYEHVLFYDFFLNCSVEGDDWMDL